MFREMVKKNLVTRKVMVIIYLGFMENVKLGKIMIHQLFSKSGTIRKHFAVSSNKAGLSSHIQDWGALNNPGSYYGRSGLFVANNVFS